MIDLPKYFFDRNIETKKTGKNIGKYIGINTCLFCGIGGYHLGISQKTGHVSCWACGSHSLNELIYKIEKSWYKVNKVLAEYVLDADKLIFEDEEKIVVKNYKLPIEFVEKFDEPYKLYLKNRGFDFLELRKKYNILCCNSGRARYRIIFPVFENKIVVNWVARTILANDKSMPYMFEKDSNNPIVTRKELLYGLDDCNGDTVILTEGVFDKVNIGTNCIAMLSIVFSKEQILKLRRFKNFFIAFDNEEKAQKRAKVLESYLTWADNINYINFDKKDLALFDKKEVLELRRLCF